MFRRRCGTSATGWLVFAVLTTLAARGANATTIDGVEFSSWETIDTVGGVDLDLHTSEDLYVFVPNGLSADQFTLVAEDMIVIEDGVPFPFAQNDPLICEAGCDLESFERAGDVVLRILDPLGTINLNARNIVVSVNPIPEPASSLLLALGLLALSCRRVHAFGPESSPGPAALSADPSSHTRGRHPSNHP